MSVDIQLTITSACVKIDAEIDWPEGPQEVSHAAMRQLIVGTLPGYALAMLDALAPHPRDHPAVAPAARLVVSTSGALELGITEKEGLQ